jgi:hypothetical protein
MLILLVSMDWSNSRKVKAKMFNLRKIPDPLA